MTRRPGNTWSLALLVAGSFLVALGLFIGLQTPDAITFEIAKPAILSCGAPFHPATDASKPVCASSLHRRKERGAVVLLVGVVVIGVGAAIWATDRRRRHTNGEPAVTTA